MSLLKAKSVDATEGPLLKKIIIYAIPLILSTLIQQLFNAVDLVVLGNMADSAAVASVGATGAITSLLVNTFVGLASGTRVVLARQIGAKDDDGVRRTTDTSLILALGIGIVIAVGGFVLAPWFLDITQCPTECYEGALIYVRIYLCGAPIILLYNFGSSAVTASGDTQRPLYYIMIGGVTNLVLNIILCLILPQKVIAVAVATVASQVISAVLISVRLFKMDGPCKVVLSKFRFSIGALGTIFRFGLPMALIYALFPLSNLQIQSAINSYGVAATAGNSAASTIETVLSAFTGPFGTTVATFMGQNIGAKKPDRVKKSFSKCMLLSVTIGGSLGVLVYLTGRFWLGLIVGGDALAVEYGMIRMLCTTLFYIVNAVNTVYANALQAYGCSSWSAGNSIFCVLIFRVIWMQGLYPLCEALPTFERFFVVVVCFIVSWFLRMLVNVALFELAKRKYMHGERAVI
jgi:putative MATE family efflux protein